MTLLAVNGRKLHLVDVEDVPAVVRSAGCTVVTLVPPAVQESPAAVIEARESIARAREFAAECAS